MVDLNKTEKLLKEAHRKLDDYLSEQEIEGDLRKKVIHKVKRFAKLANPPLLYDEDSDGETADTPLSLRQLAPQTAVVTVSLLYFYDTLKVALRSAKKGRQNPIKGKEVHRCAIFVLFLLLLCVWYRTACVPVLPP
jgi:hypothetical protein